MLTALKTTYQLIDEILDNGLPYVVSYLEKSINKTITIIDINGHIYYPDVPENQDRIDDMFIQLLSKVKGKQYYYNEIDKRLWYPVECGDRYVYILVQKLMPNMIQATLAILHESKLAIKCYFTSLNKASIYQKNFERELLEYLLFRNNTNIDDIIKLSEKDLDINNPYFTVMLASDEVGCKIDWQAIGSYSKNYIKNINLDVITLISSNSLITIVPAISIGKAMEIGSNRLRTFYRDKYKENVEKRFNITLSQGIGNIHTLQNVRKSYDEARYALILPRLIGSNQFIQEFNELGLYSLLFSNDKDHLESYCYKTLAKLAEYDENNDTELINTLRELFSNNINWKITASKLFIHVNTLHYRVNKIEELLGIDISQMNARLNLYTAIKVWDTLQINSYTE